MYIAHVQALMEVLERSIECLEAHQTMSQCLTAFHSHGMRFSPFLHTQENTQTLAMKRKAARRVKGCRLSQLFRSMG